MCAEKNKKGSDGFSGERVAGEKWLRERSKQNYGGKKGERHSLYKALLMKTWHFHNSYLEMMSLQMSFMHC